MDSIKAEADFFFPSSRLFMDTIRQSSLTEAELYLLSIDRRIRKAHKSIDDTQNKGGKQ